MSKLDCHMTEQHQALPKLPRDRDNDYQIAIIQQRQALIAEHSPTDLQHTRRYSIDPEQCRGRGSNVNSP